MRQFPEGFDKGLARKLFPQYNQTISAHNSTQKQPPSHKSSLQLYNNSKLTDQDFYNSQSNSGGPLNAAFIGIIYRMNLSY